MTIDQSFSLLYSYNLQNNFILNLNLQSLQILYMKFKGQTVKGTKKQYSLKQQLGEGGFSVIYSTNDPELICKVQVLSNPQISKAYKNQKQALQNLQHKNIVLLKDAFELKQKNDLYGFLILQNCSAGNVFKILESYGENNLPEKLILKIFYYVASALDYMHKKGIAHRDIKLQNVLVTVKGQYKLCDFGSSSKQIIRSITKQNRPDIQEYIQKTTTPLYRSPQQLDLYSGFQIGTEVDIFALGVLVFMLCFKKQPFQTRLSAINNQYFIPEQTPYSSELISLIQRCFSTNPKQRIKTEQIKKTLIFLMDKKVAQIQINIQRQLQSTLTEIQKINNQMLKQSNQVAESSIFDRIKRIYNQITTQTEGWIAGFVEDNEQAPQLKYNRSIISKCWEKRYKVEKMYEILWKYTDQNKSKSLVHLKLLILLHNFLRKGPPQSITYDGKYSPAYLCTKIYKNWKLNQRPIDSEDIKRNSYVCLVLRYYSLIITTKFKLCFQNSDLIQGNFSILPYLRSKKQLPILRLPFICELIKFLQMSAQFLQILASHSYLIQIQRIIILSLVDEAYCCVSLLVFLIAAFKEAICHLNQELDINSLQKKIKVVQRDFQEVYTKLSKLFESANKISSVFQQETSFTLNAKVIQYIKSINIRQKKVGSFQFSKHINYQKVISGLKIPLSYEQAVKNPNFLNNLQRKDDMNVVQMNQYKIKNKSSENSNKLAANQIERKITTQNNLPTNSNNNLNFTNNSMVNNANQNKTNKENNNLKNKQKEKSPNSSSIQEKQKNGKSSPKSNQNQSKLKVSSNLQKSNINNSMMMEFTHQNLNKDMSVCEENKLPTDYNCLEVNSKVQTTQNHFKDFLNMVDDKFAQSNLNQKRQTAKNQSAFQQFQQPNLFKNTSQTSIKNTKPEPLLDIFSDFNKKTQDITSKNNSSKQNIFNKSTNPSKDSNNIFNQPSNNNFFNQSCQDISKNQNNFNNFIKLTQDKVFQKKQDKVGFQKSDQIRQKQKVMDKSMQNSQQRQANISIISKQIFESLNKKEKGQKAVQIMRFQDQE